MSVQSGDVDWLSVEPSSAVTVSDTLVARGEWNGAFELSHQIERVEGSQVLMSDSSGKRPAGSRPS